eukprot:Colp12_sorted_trinity150504_noHs@12174
MNVIRSLLELGRGSRSRTTLSVDISKVLPNDVTLMILTHLDAPDLHNLSCLNERWRKLADKQFLWKRLCQKKWPLSKRLSPELVLNLFPPSQRTKMKGTEWKLLYIILDEGIVCFNSNPSKGLSYLQDVGVLQSNEESITSFLVSANGLDGQVVASYVSEQHRRLILESYFDKLPFSGLSVVEALRLTFRKLQLHPQLGRTRTEAILNALGDRYVACNRAHWTSEMVVIISYSIMVLCLDLHSTKIRNKISKREYIKNCRAVPEVAGLGDDYFGSLYDDIYFCGSILPVDARPQ